MSIYTGQQKKGYKVIYLLFYKTEWHILFAYCKHNLCCFRVDLPNLNQVQWSETSAHQFEWFCTTCTISQLLGTMEAQIVVVVERECSKPAENQQTLITNRLQETLVLAQNTQNNEKNKDILESIPIDLDKWLFCYSTSSFHHPAYLYREGSICE